MRGAHDGPVQFSMEIKRLQCGVCKSCARAHLAVLRASALECGAGPADARLSSRESAAITCNSSSSDIESDEGRTIRNYAFGMAIAFPDRT